MELVLGVGKLQELVHIAGFYNLLLELLGLNANALGVLFLREQVGADDVVVDAHQAVDGIVADLFFLAMLDRKLQHLDLLGIVTQALGKNNSLKPAKTWVFGGKTTQTGKAAVAVDDQAVGQHHAGALLRTQGNATLRLFDGILIAVDDKTLNDVVAGRDVQLIKRTLAMFGLIAANPRGDAVVLHVIAQELKLNAVNGIHLGLAVDHDFVVGTGRLNVDAVADHLEQVHVDSSYWLFLIYSSRR